MNIIKSTPNPSGAYPPVQSWSEETPPDGYYAITTDTSEFFNGFIIPTIENGVVTSFVCNTEAREAWLASLPPEQPPTPTPQEDTDAMLVDHEFRITLVELGV